MEKNIYDLLNQVKTELGDYEIRELEQHEKDESIERIKRILRKLDNSVMQDISGKKENGSRKTIAKKMAGAAAGLLVCFLVIGGAVYATTDGEAFDYMISFMTGGMIFEKSEQNMSGEKSTVSVVTASAAPLSEDGESVFPLMFEDGRLYFTGDGGKTDISDKISETEPYYIDIIDEEGVTHRFCIGGRAERGYYGYQEMIIDSEGIFRGSSGYLGENITESPTAWENKATEEMMRNYMP